VFSDSLITYMKVSSAKMAQLTMGKDEDVQQ